MADIRSAAARIRHSVHRTPLLGPFGMGVLDVALYGAIASQARHLGFGSLVDLG
ncbi:hypothetical protein [Amycolatopsis sp. EV170708-02-1]|uniref:hypothetical protein n=1 Tax=Amycolatopsis sp. EV170708-02-1 TaxID=2919322 RepID=UPI001F0B8584|nr:hypothetical protein [Amycolatopsis sp. EV170708-02-1]UMO99895.1 hypothetical protein MJQ72_25640 [Amycolatopsis sp. EV170708-02-1]